MLLPLHRLVFPPNMPAGLDWAVIGLWVCTFRKTWHPCDPPIEVRPVPDAVDLWQICDGRHRTIAALISGRTHIHAEVAAA